MKNLLTLLLAFSLTATFAQTDSEIKDRRNGLNELKFNAGTALFELLELSYERVLNNDMGVGMSVSYSSLEGQDYRGSILPYFRFYPSEKQVASGFFLEANTGVIFSESTGYFIRDSNGQYVEDDEQFVSFGFGVAVGGKFISRTGLFGEIFGGIGREFLDESYIEVYPRVGLNFGYRF
ncbi:MAG: hypothetical protein WBG42_15405 [Cryomorphaceae bacterium]